MYAKVKELIAWSKHIGIQVYILRVAVKGLIMYNTLDDINEYEFINTELKHL